MIEKVLKETKRIKLEIEVRREAIRIAELYGQGGIDFFCNNFKGIAEAYAQAKEQEDEVLISNPFEISQETIRTMRSVAETESPPDYLKEIRDSLESINEILKEGIKTKVRIANC